MDVSTRYSKDRGRLYVHQITQWYTRVTSGVVHAITSVSMLDPHYHTNYKPLEVVWTIVKP